jgi:hypothetical protein
MAQDTMTPWRLGSVAQDTRNPWRLGSVAQDSTSPLVCDALTTAAHAQVGIEQSLHCSFDDCCRCASRNDTRLAVDRHMWRRHQHGMCCTFPLALTQGRRRCKTRRLRGSSAIDAFDGPSRVSPCNGRRSNIRSKRRCLAVVRQTLQCMGSRCASFRTIVWKTNRLEPSVRP